MAGLFRYPLVILAVILAASVFLGWQSRDFQIDASAETLISRGNAQFIENQKINQAFSPEEFLIVAYQPHDGDIFSSRSQRDLTAISDELRKLERVASVRSLVDVPLLQAGKNTLSADLDPEKLSQRHLQLGKAQLEALFRGHPFYEGLLVNKEHTVTGIQVLFKADKELAGLEAEMLTLREKALEGGLSKEENRRLEQLEAEAEPIEKALREARGREIQHIRGVLEPYQQRANLYLGGPHVLGHQLIEIIKQDLKLFGSVIAAVVALLVLLIFRAWRWLLITGLCCLTSLLITLGGFALLGLKATVISANFIALQLILCLAIIVHLIVQYREETAADPQASQRQLVLRSLRHKLAPCFFAGLTTSVGFASLLLSAIEPVSAFGLMMMLAMAITLIVTLLLFPALLLLFPRERPRQPSAVFSAPLNLLANWSLNKSRWVIGGSALLLLLGGIGALRLDVENSFIDYFRADTQVHRELKFIDQEFGGTTPLDIIYTPEINAAVVNDKLPLRARDVQNTHRIQDALAQFEAVGSTLSIVNFTQLAKQINGGRPLTEYELAAVYWILDDAIRENLVGSFFIDSPPRVRISARIQDTTEGLDRHQLLVELRGAMDELGIPEDQYQFANLFVLYQAMLQQLFDSQILTLGVVMGVLTLVFWLVFRSLRIALLAMMPNILATVGILGIMGWLGIPLDFMTMTIAAIAMGIAVDDTIHYTHRYLKELRTGTREHAVTSTQQSVGYALVYTTAIIALGFSLLMGSDFLPTMMFGGLTAAAVLLALLADLALLPALLRRWGPAAASTT